MNGAKEKFAGLAFGLALLCAVLPSRMLGKETPGKERQPVLVELFTSEGCSSCPPADRLAIQLQDGSNGGRNVIVLSEHVDYWNHLGWRDNFSSPQFTIRQNDYLEALKQASVYTPEMVVDGKLGMVGSDNSAVLRAIDQCHLTAKATLTLSLKSAPADPLKRALAVTVSCPADLSGKRAHLYVAITEDNLRTNVESGENEGVVLLHTGVVRHLEKVGSLVVLDPARGFSCTEQLTLDPLWRKGQLRAVAFLQDAATRAILGAGQIKVE